MNIQEDFSINISKETSFDKFGAEQWKQIEVMYSDNIQNILKMMCKLGNPTNEFNNITITTIGDEIYLDIIRPILINLKIIENIEYESKEKIKNKKKNINKKEEIIKQNIIKKVKDKFNEIIDNYNKNNNLEVGFKSIYIELRLIEIMFQINKLINKGEKGEKLYDIIIGSKKILNNSKNINGISKILIDDLERLIDRAKKYNNYTSKELFINYPKLVISNSYTKILPMTMISPYESQKDIIECVKNNIDNGAMIFYRAMIGSGKTTSSIALAKYIESIRIIEKASGNDSLPQLIFACSVETVRLEVCKMCYNMGIAFGIGIIDSRNNETVRIINSFINKNNKDRIIIITDLATTIKLLKDSQNYILFIDEPTVGADQENHPVSIAIGNIIKVCPKIIILSSATLPTPEELPDYINTFKFRHPNGIIKNIYSREALIGCEIFNVDGSTLCPHDNCKTKEELQFIINQLLTKPFIGRAYTAPILYKLIEKIKNNNIDITNLINLETYFDKIENLNQTEVQKIAIKILDFIVNNCNDNQIKNICIPIGKINIIKEEIKQESDNEQESDSDDLFESEEESEEIEEENGYNINKIFTEHAYKFHGPCLIATNNPLKFANEKSNILFENQNSANKIISNYLLTRKKYDTIIKKVDSSTNKVVNKIVEKKDGTKDKEKKVNNQEERSKIKQDIIDNIPTLDFPTYLRINTIEHLKKYANHMIEKMDKNRLRMIYPLEYLPLDLQIEDRIMQLLFAGVGIYSDQLPKQYLNKVLELASLGELAFLVADSSISYGTSYPFSHIMITDEYAENRSILSLFQLAGRAGRVDESWVANVIVEPNTAKRFKDYLYNNYDSSNEVKNLINSFNYKEEIKEPIKKEIINKEITYKLNGVDVPLKIITKEEPKKYIPPHLRNKTNK